MSERRRLPTIPYPERAPTPMHCGCKRRRSHSHTWLRGIARNLPKNLPKILQKPTKTYKNPTKTYKNLQKPIKILQTSYKSPQKTLAAWCFKGNDKSKVNEGTTYLDSQGDSCNRETPTTPQKSNTKTPPQMEIIPRHKRRFQFWGKLKKQQTTTAPLSKK